MKIYLDTNIFDALTKNDIRKEDTEMLFYEIENGRFEAYYSPTVVEEILLTKDKLQKSKLNKVLDNKVFIKKCIRLIPFNTHNDLTKIHNLVHAYWYVYEEFRDSPEGLRFVLKKSVFSKLGSQAEDRVHIATAVINKIDAFVTWNTREFIKNDKIKNWINKVNKKLGYSEISMYTPAQLLRNYSFVTN